MAGATTKSRDNVGHEQGANRDLVAEHNKLVDDVETLRASLATLVAKLNLDAGVTDTNYASPAAAALIAGKVGNENGTPLT